MIRKGQVQGGKKGDSPRQAAFIAELFAVAISAQQKNGEAPSFVFLFVFLQHSLHHGFLLIRAERRLFSRLTVRRRLF
jgi:hypothetical protein